MTSAEVRDLSPEERSDEGPLSEPQCESIGRGRL